MVKKQDIGNKILIIDDEEDIRNILKINLKSQHYEVFCAPGGEEGIEIARTQAPGLILLDMMMPGMNGNQVCKCLQEDDRTNKIPILFLTAKDSKQSKIEGLQSGAVDYITKPFEIRELSARIASHFKIQSLYREIETYVRQINQDLDLARKVQKSILPHHIPHIPGVNISATYFATEKVGGDYYDLIRLGEDEVAVVLADVSGHGIAASFITAMAKIAFTHSLKKGRSLVRVLEDINTEFNQILQTDHYLTAFIGVLNVKTRLFKYAKAGHVGQLLFTENGEKAITLKTNGLILGSFEDGQFEEKSIYLSEGDKIVLFTDGLIECKNPSNEQYGIERLKEFITQNFVLEPSTMVDALMENQTTFIGDVERIDDLTMVILELNTNSVIEEVKASCGFADSTDITVNDFTTLDQFKIALTDILNTLESQGYDFKFLREAKMSMSICLTTAFKALKSKWEKLRLVWQYDEDQFLLALFGVKNGKLKSAPAEESMEANLKHDEGSAYTLLQKIFDEVQFLENGNLLRMVKKKL